MALKNKLSNPYYFVKNNTIFKISSTNETNDSCGKHYVTYTTNPESSVKKGDTYIDLHGDRVTADEDKTGVVSTGIIDAAESAKTFPHFKVTEDGDETENAYYFWLDDFIEDGDVLKTVDNTPKFMKTKHTDDDNEPEEVDFAEDYVNDIKMKIVKSIISGKSFEDAIRSYPAFLFAETGDSIKLDGKTVEVKDVKSSFSITSLPVIAKADLEETIYGLINEMVVNYANGLLKTVDKKLKDETEELVTQENTEAI